MKNAMQKATPDAKHVLAVLASVSLGVASLPGAGQEVEAEDAEERSRGRIEEVIVTVERREQNLQDLGVTAYNFQGEDLKMQGVQDITDLSELAPGLEIGNKGGNIEVWIRGVGSSNNTELGDPAAATHLDGVYIPRTSGIGSAFSTSAGWKSTSDPRVPCAVATQRRAPSTSSRGDPDWGARSWRSKPRLETTPCASTGAL